MKREYEYRVVCGTGTPEIVHHPNIEEARIDRDAINAVAGSEDGCWCGRADHKVQRRAGWEDVS